MSCNEALSSVKWRTSHRIWQRCPENTGSNKWPSTFPKKLTRWKNFCTLTLYRKDAESLNATSLAVIAGMKNNFSYELVEFSLFKVPVAEASSSFSWSTSGFSSWLFLPRCFYICQWQAGSSNLEGSVLLLGFPLGQSVSGKQLTLALVRSSQIRILEGSIPDDFWGEKFMGEWIWSQSIFFLGKPIRGWKNLVLLVSHCTSCPPSVLWPVFKCQ